MLPGERIDRYTIVSKIGEGGMGEVYLAEDSKLSRKVAIKILSSRNGENDHRLIRFEHEARSVSSLNHPNIVTIYEIGEADGKFFIVMEFVEGRTLARILKTDGIEHSRSFDICIQIVSALASAHKANVIHRDIKPDNIVIRPDGLVKILDFGLAKVSETPTPSDENFGDLSTIFKTNPGLILGTVGYMSPEQARGKALDPRTDIFSLGTIMYEMFSGRRPFVGENDVDLLASIIHKEPEPISDGNDGMQELDRLIRKTLRKQRSERYQTATELLADLRDLRLSLTGEVSAGYITDYSLVGPTGEDYRYRSRSSIARSSIQQQPSFINRISSSSALKTMLSLIVLTLISSGGYFWYQNSRSDPDFGSMRITRLTRSGTISSSKAAISPDGKLVAYVVQEAGLESLWLRQTANESGVTIIDPAAAVYEGITFSRDSSHIYYTLAEKEETSLNQVAALGGIPRKILSNLKGRISFSADGRRFAFVRDSKSLMIANSDGTGEQTIAKAPDGDRWSEPAWSPDGAKVSAISYSAPTGNNSVVQANVDSGEMGVLTKDWVRLTAITWLSDGSGVLASGRDKQTLLSQIWFIDGKTGASKRITNDIAVYYGVSVDAEGRNVVTTQESFSTAIWKGDLVSPEFTKLTEDLGRHEGTSGLALSRENKIFYTARTNIIDDLWVMDADGSRKTQLTFEPAGSSLPTISPDGKFMTFISSRAGHDDLWRSDVDGRSPKQLLNTEEENEGPSDITRDGKWIYYQHFDGKSANSILKLPADGGSPTVVETNAIRPAISPDGDQIAFLRPVVRNKKILVLKTLNGNANREFDLSHNLLLLQVRWSRDGKNIIYMGTEKGVDNLYSLSLSTGQIKQTTNFSSDRIYRFDVSRVDDSVVISRGNQFSDAMVISDFSTQ